MKRIYWILTLVLVMGLVISPAFAKGKKGNKDKANTQNTADISPKAKGPSEKATGGVGYDAYGLYRRIEFNAHEQSDTCEAFWSLVGNWVISVNYKGGLYNHDMSITDQDGAGNIEGTGAYPAGGPYSITWQLVNSYVDGNMVHLEFDYGTGYIAVLDGAIAPDGTMSGNWSSNSNQSGTWTSTYGFASQVVTGCEGKGMLHYSDANGNWYDVDVQSVKVDGDIAWFAGPVISASDPSWTSYWLFAKVLDGGEPAAGVDQVWGSFTTMEDAKAGVANMIDPINGPFTVQDGNLQVHIY